MNRPVVFTLGHGLLPLEGLMRLLRENVIDLVLDVRSQPFSARAPHFTTEALASSLVSEGFAYRWVPALGGRPNDRLSTMSGSPDYERMALQPDTLAALDEVARSAWSKRIALLCSESRPEECHRSRMLEPELAGRGVWVDHILHTGDVERVPTLFS